MSDTVGAGQAARDHKRHLMHSWSALPDADPVVVTRGEHVWFWDAAGRRYLDLASQLVNLSLGHQHPDLLRAIREQAARLCTISPSFANDTRGTAARLILERAPGQASRVLFTNGGADAVENAVRLARLHTGRSKVLSAYRSYHGSTTTAITATGDPRRWPNEPGDPGIVHFWGPYPYRSPFHSRDEAEEAQRALQHVSEVLMVEGPHTVAAVLVEPVVGTNGILVPPDGYLAGLRALCDQHGALLIADEVMSGFGRCGEWFAVDRWGVAPDLITFAKGVNSGYVPLGGVIVSERVAASFADRAFPGGLTYSGHPLACAPAVATIEVFERDAILEHVRGLETEVWAPGLTELARRHPSVGQARGLGCFWALELVRDTATREPLVPFNASGQEAAPMLEVVAACKERGVWPFAHHNRLHVAPPLVISPETAWEAIAALDEALTVSDRYARPDG